MARSFGAALMDGAPRRGGKRKRLEFALPGLERPATNSRQKPRATFLGQALIKKTVTDLTPAFHPTCIEQESTSHNAETHTRLEPFFFKELVRNLMKADVYWIPESHHGRLAIMPRPRAGDWLEDELEAWKREGVSTIISLLTKFEEIELGLEQEREVCAARGIAFISFPINDRQVPTSYHETKAIVDNISGRLLTGHGVAIHCRMGVGRSALIAALILKKQGYTSDAAFEVIRKSRGVDVPDTKEQRKWAEAFVL